MRFIKGNLLEAQTQALINTVNTVGVMGKGIALQFKEAFPENFKSYASACKTGELQPGKLLVTRENSIEGEKIIINFPTKTEWFRKSTYEYIELGLAELVKVIEQYRIKSIAIPPLGCGNGGLKWDKVKPLIERHLSSLQNIDIVVYEPNDAVKELLKRQESKKEVKLTDAKAMLLYAMFYYEMMGEATSLFVANKLAYFLKRLGEKTFEKLSFEASHYGPYSVQVEHMLQNMNGKYLKGLEQMTVKAFDPLELQYSRIDEVRGYINKELTSEQRTRIKNLIALIDGFQSALSLELLATVDFVQKDKPKIQHEEITKSIHNWSERKRKLFQEKYISVAINHLQDYSTKLRIA
jgi:O-acetyl-ADP-ribose deacetylase (regulator of RNase III)